MQTSQTLMAGNVECRGLVEDRQGEDLPCRQGSEMEETAGVVFLAFGQCEARLAKSASMLLRTLGSLELIGDTARLDQ